MKQIDIVKAYTALKRLSGYNLPVRKSYEVFSLTKRLEEFYQFSASEEQKMIDKYGGEMKDGGIVTFPDTETASKYKEEATVLANMEVDLNINKIKLSFDDFGNQTIPPAVLNDLSDVIQFE